MFGSREQAWTRTPTFLAATLFVAACASPRPTAPITPATEGTAASQPQRERADDLSKDECRTVLDCMRARGAPSVGMQWSCDLGLCAAQFAAAPESRR
jgi:hypothetical protein